MRHISDILYHEKIIDEAIGRKSEFEVWKKFFDNILCNLQIRFADANQINKDIQEIREEMVKEQKWGYKHAKEKS